MAVLREFEREATESRAAAVEVLFFLSSLPPLETRRFLIKKAHKDPDKSKMGGVRFLLSGEKIFQEAG